MSLRRAAAAAVRLASASPAAAAAFSTTSTAHAPPRALGLGLAALAGGALAASALTASALAAATPAPPPAAPAPAAAAAAPAAAAAAAAAAASAPRVERTFIAVKPDGVERRLIAAVVDRFERRGYRLAAAKVVVPGRALADEHYAEHRGKPFQPSLVDFLSSGPVFAFVVEGEGCIKAGRAMIGATNPQASAPGTIRGDYGVVTSRNIVHGSDSPESAEREIALWFKADEVASGVVPTDARHSHSHGSV